MSVINNVADIPRSIPKTKQTHQDAKRQIILFDEADHDYIQGKIECRNNIYYEIQIHNDDKNNCI